MGKNKNYPRKTNERKIEKNKESQSIANLQQANHTLMVVPLTLRREKRYRLAISQRWLTCVLVVLGPSEIRLCMYWTSLYSGLIFTIVEFAKYISAQQCTRKKLLGNATCLHVLAPQSLFFFFAGIVFDLLIICYNNTMNIKKLYSRLQTTLRRLEALERACY